VGGGGTSTEKGYRIHLLVAKSGTIAPTDNKYLIVTGLGYIPHKSSLLMRSQISSARQEVSQTGDDSIFAARQLAEFV